MLVHFITFINFSDQSHNEHCLDFDQCCFHCYLAGIASLLGTLNNSYENKCSAPSRFTLWWNFQEHKPKVKQELTVSSKLSGWLNSINLLTKAQEDFTGSINIKNIRPHTHSHRDLAMLFWRRQVTPLMPPPPRGLLSPPLPTLSLSTVSPV
jgi:hypothetical protein